MKIFNLLGIMKKANKLIYGLDDILKMIEKKKVKLILVGSTASFNTQKKLKNKIKNNDIDVYLVVEDKKTIAEALGMKNIKVIGIIDEGFAKAIKMEV